VSIKKKFATAVATASLLAGIFGSAFVPSAFALAGVSTAIGATGGTAIAVGTTTTGAAMVKNATSGEYEIAYTQTIAAPAGGTTNAANGTLSLTLRDDNGVAVTGATVAMATSGKCYGALAGTFSATTDYAAATSTSSTVSSVAVTSDADGVFGAAIKSSDTTAGNGTCTVTFYANSLSIGSITVRVIGAASSIVLTNGGATHLAAGAASAVNTITSAVKDAAGFALTAPTDASVSWTLGTGSVGATTDVTEADNDGKYSLEATACDTADKGKTFSAYATIGTVTSNTISVTCTSAGTAAKITNVALAAQTVSPGQALKINFTVVDDGARSMGYGAAIDLVGTGHIATSTMVPGAIATGTNATLTLADATIAVVGTFTQTITASNMPGSYAVIIAIADADLNTTGSQAAEYSLAYTVTNAAVVGGADATLAAGPKQLKATATFGASAANKKVAFTLENANGAVKTYYRKADASGVATFTLRFKGTFEVTASYGDAITDTVILKK
jgi:hypothetical protein